MANTNNDIAAIKERTLRFAEDFAQAASPSLDVTVRVAADESEGLTLAFEGPDAHRLVGRNGQILDALGFIAGQVINRRGNARLRILFDADNYRAKREATLQKLATDLAEQVLATGQEAVLDPLSPMERRIIHNTLADLPGIRTYSEGEEPQRYIIITPA